MNGFGGLGGGGMDMNSMMQQMQQNPQMMQQVQQMMQNPQVRALMNKPGVLQKMQQIMQNPMMAQQYMSDPDVAQLMQLMQGGGGGMGGMGGMPSPPQQNQIITYIQSETQFMDIINSAPKDKLIVVYFFATWCKPCKKVGPEFQRLAKFYKDHAIFLKIDVDKNPSLALRRKTSSVPQFHFYKNKIKISEFRAENSKQLEDLITKNITFKDGNSNLKPSPYAYFPIQENNKPIFSKAPKYKKMKDKFSKVNAQFESEKSEYTLTNEELKLLMTIADMVADKMNYRNQKFNELHYKLLDKLLHWPKKQLPPVLDLIRILSLHPSFVEYCSKHFDDFVVEKILKMGGNGIINAANGMLTCRIIINLFNKRIAGRVLENKFTVIMNYLLNNMMVKEKVNTRKAFVRVLLHFAYCFCASKQLFKSEKIRCLSLCTDFLNRENDSDIILTILMGIGTLIFRDWHVIQFGNTLDVCMVFNSCKQKYKNNEQIGKCCDELIKAMKKPGL